ncbi:MAG: hypothetical protein GX238_02925 [Epulopiscium sp.]|nr:hypothetical protein [Candidatus Epulonipiscium sp.]
MIDFKEELKKYKPCLEVEDLESDIRSDEIQDLLDILQSIVKKQNQNNNKE